MKGRPSKETITTIKSLAAKGLTAEQIATEVDASLRVIRKHATLTDTKGSDMSSKSLYYARLPFTYAGKALARGEVFELSGSANDQKLKLIHISPVESGFDVFTDDTTGKRFISNTFAEAYKAKQAKLTNASPMEADRIEERDAKRTDYDLNPTISAR